MAMINNAVEIKKPMISAKTPPPKLGPKYRKFIIRSI